MAITSENGLIAAMASAQFQDTYEASVSTATGQFQSLWQAGGNPGAGAIPATGSGAVPTSATAGAVPFVNPSGANTMYLARMMATASNNGTLVLYDRVVHTSGLSGTVTTAQTVNTVAITRNPANSDTGAWLEWYATTGATAATATVSYTNQSGVTGRAGTAAIPASTPAGRTIPVILQSGDTGVQSVQNVTLSVSTGTAGNFGVTLSNRVCSIPLLANLGQNFNYAALGLPIVQPNACLAYHLLPSTTTSGTILTELTLAQG
jgi:hypothetical protein